MSLTTLTLLSATTYGTASGNYDGSSQDFVGNAAVAANYYAGQGNIQTVTIRVTGFVGQVVLQATLNDIPETAAWIDVHTLGDGSTVLTEIQPTTIVGNFAWLRAKVLGFDSGTINSITLTY